MERIGRLDRYLSGAMQTAPIAIGGVGGSGTRVVAAAVLKLGFSLGNDLNAALDNLAFTLLFKDEAVLGLSRDAFAARLRLFVATQTHSRELSRVERNLLATLVRQHRPSDPPVQHSTSWLLDRARRLLQPEVALTDVPFAWGWKEPNTHIVLPQLLREVPRLRYVHVVRNGLDMAFSTNQNQLQFWGNRLLNRPVHSGPRDSLAYWCAVHRRIRDLAVQMKSQFLWLDHDALCSDPEQGMDKLVQFLGAAPATVPDLASLVCPPSTSGRRNGHSLDLFDSKDLDFLRSIGHL